jgi:hypothetical protein
MTLALLILSPIPGQSLWQTIVELFDEGEGMLAQAAIYSGYNGWTFARYSKSGVSIDYYLNNYGVKYVGAPYNFEQWSHGSYAVAEYYWDGATYSCAHSLVVEQTNPDHIAKRTSRTEASARLRTGPPRRSCGASTRGVSL